VVHTEVQRAGGQLHRKYSTSNSIFALCVKKSLVENMGYNAEVRLKKLFCRKLEVLSKI
jgi:hypothetical protein